MPPHFTARLAERLTEKSWLRVREGVAGELAFVGDMWDLTSEDPDPVRWADAVVEAG
jgi:hypothetical protein